MRKFSFREVNKMGFFRNPSMKWFTFYDDEDGKPDPGDLHTFTGQIVRFLAKRTDALKTLSANFTPIQDLHGYDAPWPAGGGKNKFSIEAITGKTIYRANVQKMGSDVNAFYLGGATGATDNMTLYVNSWANVRLRTGLQVTAETEVSVSCKVKNYTADCNGFVGLRYNSTDATDQSTRAKNVAFNDIGTTNISFTTTIPANNYIILEFSPAAKASAITLAQYVEVTEFQLEIGASAPTSFAPYSNECPISGHTGADVYVEDEYDAQATPSVTISFGQTVYGGNLVVNEDGTGSVVATHAYYTDSGTGNWVRNASGSFYKLLAEASTAALANGGWCNYCDYIYSNNPAKMAVFMRAANGTISLSYHFGAIYASTDELKAAFSETPLQVVYPLATPITIPLSPGQIQTLVGTNTVWVNNATGDITVQAYGTAIT